MHIFICDDNDRIAQSIQDIIQHHTTVPNTDIHIYNNPDQMLSEVDAHTVPVPHLVFMDIELGEKRVLQRRLTCKAEIQKSGLCLLRHTKKGIPN